MQEQITYARSPTMMLTFLPSSQSMRREKYPSDKDLKEIRRDPLPFQGDNEALPPLSWTLIWQETYSNLSGIFIPESIRLWGYTMWDATRIEHTGAKEVLARQWRERWKDTDPRTRIWTSTCCWKGCKCYPHAKDSLYLFNLEHVISTLAFLLLYSVRSS